MMGFPPHHSDGLLPITGSPQTKPEAPVCPPRRGFTYRNIYRQRALLNDGLHRFRPRSLTAWLGATRT